MEISRKILRRSIHSFLLKYHYFTSTAAFLAFPFSASILLSQVIVPSSSFLLQIYNRLRILFDAAGFPSSSQLFTILNLKVSQTITSSVLTLPFSLTFLLIAKASIIQVLNPNRQKPTLPPSFSSIISLYKPLFNTFLCNSILIISANATSFCLLFFAFGFAEGLGFSSPNSLLFLSASGAILFSVVLANALVIANMALVLSGMEANGGYMAILKACVLLRGRTSMALLLALPVNLALAAVEALFQFRVVKAYRFDERPGLCVAFEGIFIAHLYSIFIVLDTVVSCLFYKSCKMGSWNEQEAKQLLRIEFTEEDNYGHVRSKNFEELP